MNVSAASWTTAVTLVTIHFIKVKRNKHCLVLKGRDWQPFTASDGYQEVDFKVLYCFYYYLKWYYLCIKW